MAITTANYLQDLVNQKNALVSALQECGVEVNANEKFNTLIPKIKGISGSANLIFKGTIAEDLEITGVDLSHDSLMSIINALKNFVTYEQVITEYPNSYYERRQPNAVNLQPNTWYEVTSAIQTDEARWELNIVVENIDTTVELYMVSDMIQNPTHWRYDNDGSVFGFTLKSVKTIQTGEIKTLTIGATNLAKLTEEEKKIATDKGWNLA